MTRESERVCVCIAAYNARATIGRAVASALAQARVSEVIVVDDASTDDTAIAAHAADDGTGRLDVVRLAKNSGPAAARNVALARSTAEIFSILDSDDFFLAGRIDALLSTTPSDWDLIADDIILVVGEPTPSYADIVCSAERPGTFDVDLATFITGNLPVAGQPRVEVGFLKPLMRRSFLDEHGLRYDERLRLGEDYAFYVSALLSGARFRVTNRAGYVAVERSNSLSACHSPADLAAILAFDERILRERALDADARQALRAHARFTRNKLAHRNILARKRESGWSGATRELARIPAAIPFVIWETWRAKVGGAVRACSTGPRRLLEAHGRGTVISSGNVRGVNVG